MFATCSVEYRGRAESTLQTGNYLIIYKGDKSLAIHGSTDIIPRNYHGYDTLCQVDNNILLFKRKSETIKIIIDNIIFQRDLDGWSDYKIKLVRTEDDLRNKLIANIHNYIPNVVEVFKEFATDYGPIDVLCIDSNGVYHVLEVKRKSAGIAACGQLRRYVDILSESRQVMGYLAAPVINRNAIRFCDKNGFMCILIDFD